MTWAAMVLLTGGGIICFLNFYLVFLRYPIFRLIGGNPLTYRFKSGVPLVGSMLVALSLIEFWNNPWLLALAAILIICDIDGIHWYVVMFVYFEWVRGKAFRRAKNRN